MLWLKSTELIAVAVEMCDADKAPSVFSENYFELLLSMTGNINYKVLMAQANKRTRSWNHHGGEEIAVYDRSLNFAHFQCVRREGMMNHPSLVVPGGQQRP